MDRSFAPRLQPLLAAAVADPPGLPGVVAMACDRGGVIFSGAAGVRRLGAAAPMTLNTLLALYSCTKALTATAALRLVEDGRLELDRPARDYLPDIGELQVLDGFSLEGAPRLRPPKRDITPRMLMLHTAGFGYDFLHPDVKRLVAEGHVPSHRTATRAGFQQPLVNEPGEMWEYGISIDWLGMIVERIVGERLDAVLRAFVLDPLGMADTAHLPHADARARLAALHQREPDGALTPLAIEPREAMEVFSGGSGMYGTAPDYLRFLQMWLNDGRGPNGPVLRPETVAWAVQAGLGEPRVRALATTDPRLSLDMDLVGGAPATWAYSFLLNREPLPTGRAAGSLAWAGLANLFFWIDRTNGFAGFWATQVFPFLDPTAISAARRFEAEIYAGLTAA